MQLNFISIYTERINKGISFFSKILKLNKHLLSKYKCTFLVTYDTKNAVGKYNTLSVFNNVKNILRSTFSKKCLQIKVLKKHTASELKKEFETNQCICGFIYIGHASSESPRIIFDAHSSSISSQPSPMQTFEKFDVSELSTKNLLPNNISAIFGCKSAKKGTSGILSISEAFSKHFRGIVIGSENGLNFDGGNPYTPNGYTLFRMFSTSSPSNMHLEEKCCCK